MAKTINDFLSPDDLMMAGPAVDAPKSYWSDAAIEGDGNQKQGLTWDVVRATDNINKQAQQNFDYTNPMHYINPLKWGPAAGATLIEGVIDPLAQYARGEDVSRADAALAAAEVIPAVGAGTRLAGQGAKQFYKSEGAKLFSNVPNYVKGFYGADRAPGVMDAAQQGLISSAKQFASPEASTRFAEKGISSKTTEVIERNKEFREKLFDQFESTGAISDDQLAQLKHSRKEDHGQIVYNGLIARQSGNPAPAAEKYMDEVYHSIEDSWDKQAFLDMPKPANSSHISDEVMSDAFDLIGDTWKTPDIKGLKKGKTVNETGSLMAIKKMRGPKSTGVHDRDIISSAAYNQLKDAMTANGRDFDDTEELLAMLRKVEGPKYSIKKSDDGGVFVQFSPEMKSGYVEGGTNAIMYIDNDRKMTFFVSDEHDMFGIVPPGFDRAITVLPPWTVDNFASTRKVKRRKMSATEKSEVETAYANVTDKKSKGKFYDKKAADQQAKNNAADKKAELKKKTQKKKETLVDPMTAAQRSAVDEITAPVKVNYGRYAGRRAVPAGILGAGIAYGNYENE